MLPSFLLSCLLLTLPSDLQLPVDTWVKLSPLPGGPPCPRLGYEGACAWDGRDGVMIRYGGHNQGGGGEQHSEVWTFDPLAAKWALKEPDISPPGVCCAQQNIFDPVQGRYLRFPSFSGSHGWQWWREIYLNDASVWSYDPGANVWRDRRPLPAASPRPLRCASWDSDHQVVVMFGGENSREGTVVYDPRANEWTWMHSSPQPEFRSGGNMAYDAARRLHILFGSQFNDDPHTWAYDLSRNEWRDMRPEVQPPTKENDAVLTYDPLRRVAIAVVKISRGKEDEERHRLETWTYDAGANRWTPLKTQREPDPTGNRARVLMFAPELGAALLENRTHPPQGEHEQQVWALRLSGGSVEAGPRPPMDLKVATGDGSATLSWNPDPSGEPSRYFVYRGTGEKPWKVEYRKVAEIGGKERAWTGGGLERGKVHYHAIRSVDAAGKEGAWSIKVPAQPASIEEAAVSVISSSRVELSWKPSGEPDVAGYVVERAPVEVLTEDRLKRLEAATPPLEEPSVGAIVRIGGFQRLASAPIAEPRFADTSIDLSKPVKVEGEPSYERELYEEHLDKGGKPYRFAVHAYRIRAVNRLGVEGGPSPALFTIPSAPRWVFSREEGTTCRLKWAANPEKGLRGYRVYRMDGRWDGDKIPRLTPEPIQALAFTDPGAGKDTRRYYLVAVDSLGQEGFPSSPVWFDREWKAHYVPFVGEWHQ